MINKPLAEVTKEDIQGAVPNLPSRQIPVGPEAGMRCSS